MSTASTRVGLMLVGICSLFVGLTAAPVTAQGDGAGAPVTGDRLDPATYGAGVIEGWDVVRERDRNRPETWDANPKDRENAHGVWVVPSLGATFFPHSGQRYVTNKWGDTRMGIGFGEPVDVEGMWIAGQAREGAWTTGLRAIGFLGGVEVAATGWFEDIDHTPSLFAVGFRGVDRIVLEARAVLNGGGWYAVDDLIFVRPPRPDEPGPRRIVLDFEDTAPRQKLTGSGYGGLVWETGTGDFGEGEGVHAPIVPLEQQEEEPVVDGGGPPAEDGQATLPELISSFQGTIRGEAGSNSFPPDTCGAIGPNHFLITVNRVIAVFDRATGQKLDEATLGAFLPGSNGDPRVLFDQYSQRWIVLVTDFNRRYYLAVSRTDDPNGNWFKTDFVVSTGPDSGKWPDYPTLGVDEEGIYSAAYMVGGSATMSIFAIEKAPLVGPSPRLGTVTAFRTLPWENAMHPAHTWGTAPGAYIISRGSAQDLNVRLVRGPLTSPTLEGPWGVAVPPHNSPPGVPALGSTTPLNPVGPRLINAVYRDGSLWAAHTIEVDGRAACRWYEIDAANARLLQVGTVSDPVLGYFFPGISVNAQRDVVMGFSGSHANQYAGAYYTGRRANDPWGQMATPVQYRAGQGPQNLIDSFGRNRWGDYSLTTLDPTDEITLWTMQEYAHGNNIWGTEVAELRLLPGPDNDFCLGAREVGEGVTPFSTIDATTDGPDEPAECNFNGYTHLESDVWFTFDPPCTGEATFSLCGSGFDTKIAIYESCPTISGTPIACNDNVCGQQSELTIPVTEGGGLYLRVGGFNSAQGEGTLTITCTPQANCPPDVNGDGTVDVLDLLAVLSAWGQSGVPEDINGDGIVDVLDLLEVLSAWGPCP